jgi:nicotinamidase/pyrazinamidase
MELIPGTACCFNSLDTQMTPIHLTEKDALIIVDVQNDFLPGGSLAVPRGNEVVPMVNRYIARFHRKWLPVYATRDWHPAGHCSFLPQGGIWPQHCVADTRGAQFANELDLPDSAIVVSKAITPTKDAYSGFQGTGLGIELRSRKIERIFVGGLAADYCVLNTVQDGLAEGFEVLLLLDAIRAVDVHPGDGDAAIQTMIRQGARPITLLDLDEPVHLQSAHGPSNPERPGYP